MLKAGRLLRGVGDPERAVGQAAVNQSRKGLRVGIVDDARRHQVLQQPGKRRHALLLRGVGRRTQHRPRVLQHDAADLGLGRHAQVGPAASTERVPGGGSLRRNGIQALVHLVVDLFDDGRQQAFLVTEMVIQSPSRQPRGSGQIVHGRRGVPRALKGVAGSRHQFGPGGFDHLGARTRHAVLQ
ncbi:hypothetical protein D3C71_1431860 [compost metagenome]